MQDFSNEIVLHLRPTPLIGGRSGEVLAARVNHARVFWFNAVISTWHPQSIISRQIVEREFGIDDRSVGFLHLHVLESEIQRLPPIKFRISQVIQGRLGIEAVLGMDFLQHYRRACLDTDRFVLTLEKR